MKISLLALLFIPLLSFGQEDVSDELSRKEKKSIDSYALKMCDCMNDLMSELHPKTLDIIHIMAGEDQDEAMLKVKDIFNELDSDEQKKLMASIERMDESEFQTKTKECDGSDALGEELKARVDSMEGAAYDYLWGILCSEESCKIMKSLIELGNTSDE